MEPIAVMTLFLGLFVVVSRGALLVAPAASIQAFRMLLERPSWLRLMGALFFLLGLGFVQTAPAVPQHPVASPALTALGWALLAGAALLLIWPRGYQLLAKLVIDALADGSVLRVIGALGVLVGLGFVWLAITLN